MRNFSGKSEERDDGRNGCMAVIEERRKDLRQLLTGNLREKVAKRDRRNTRIMAGYRI